MYLGRWGTFYDDIHRVVTLVADNKETVGCHSLFGVCNE